jgi:hypothetical protein
MLQNKLDKPQDECGVFGIFSNDKDVDVASDWLKISIKNLNEPLINATCYYYSENEPTTTGNYWHYDENGNVVV